MHIDFIKDALRSAIERLGKNEHAFDLDAEPEPIVESHLTGSIGGPSSDVIDDGYGPINDDDDYNNAGNDSGIALKFGLFALSGMQCILKIVTMKIVFI